MSYTYNLNTPNDITRCRFHIRDTDSVAPMFQDEEITFMISENGDWMHAVIQLLTAKIAELDNTPAVGMGPLWMRTTDERASLMRLLQLKRLEFNIPLIVAAANYIYRPDATDTTQAPTFDDTVSSGNFSLPW